MRLLKWTIVLLAIGSAGCAGGQAVLTGHDFIQQAVAALGEGVAEYHRQDVERLDIARRQAAEALVQDVVACADDAQAVRGLTGQFLDAVARIDRAGYVEAQRLRRMEEWMDRLNEVNASLRQRAEWRLRVDGQLGGYLSALREKAYGQRPAVTPD